MNYEANIGKWVCKCSITTQVPNNKPFKSTFLTNTVKGVIIHPTLNIPAYTFEEDDSYVECRRCVVTSTTVCAIGLKANGNYTDYQEKLLKLIADNPNTIIITAEQGFGYQVRPIIKTK